MSSRIEKTLDAHLGPGVAAPRDEDGATEARTVLGLLGVGPAEAAGLEPEVETLIEQARALGVDPDLASPVTQAYVRAVGARREVRRRWRVPGGRRSERLPSALRGRQRRLRVRGVKGRLNVVVVRRPR